MTKPASPQIPDELRPYLDTIADRLLSGHAAVMIGAGFSKNAISQGSGPGFPDWSQMGDRFFERLHGRPPGAGDSITAATKGAGMAAAEILFVDHLEELKDLESLRPIRHRKEASL